MAITVCSGHASQESELGCRSHTAVDIPFDVPQIWEAHTVPARTVVFYVALTVTPNPIPSDTPPGKPLRKRKSNAEIWAASLKDLASRLLAIAPTQVPVVIDHYSARLCKLLSELRSREFAVDRVCKRMNKALSKGDIGSYINDACELAVVSHFLDRFPENFRYQVPVEAGNQGTPKNFDFSFSAEGFEFNVEVKSFTPEPMDRPRRLVKSFLPRNWTHELVNQGAEFEANCMPAITRLMTTASAQLPRSNGAHNVMLLCCNDLDEFADVLTCLIGPHGICHSTESNGLLPGLSKFLHIDTVVICHLGFQHLCVLEPNRRSKFCPNGSADMDGGQAWTYPSALPISVNLRRIPLADAQALALGRAFNLHDVYFYSRLDSIGSNCQEALFDIFNTLTRSLAVQRECS
ncbi:hypothetical protein [Aquitalea sp.]|uniref:hypothetical protein n=1 Tax=Aquitalea sp. TaxID=1872623 RepID=UPI002590BC5C|nr:hypothetical protein [Aquitalea sp.]